MEPSFYQYTKCQPLCTLLYKNCWGLPDIFLTFAIECQVSGLILGLHIANERRRYFVTTFLIDWAQT